MIKKRQQSSIHMSQGSCGLIALIVMAVIGAVLFGINFGIGWYGTECGDEPIFECIERISQNIEKDVERQVTATGPYSYKDYSIVMTLDIPLDGGEVEGKVTGDCAGRVTGSFDGQKNGILKGKFAGSCSVFLVNIPAKADIDGTVIQDAKSVPVGFQGGGGGFTHSDSFTLSY